MSQPTKKLLAMAMKDMLSKRTLDKITVKDLVEVCEIKRQTFYYHFSDIYDLLEWIYFTEAEKAIGKNRTYATWMEGFYQVFEYVNENKKFVENTYRSVSREYLETFLYKVVYELLINVVEELPVNEQVQYADKKFIADFYKYGFVGLMLEWIKDGMKEDPRILIAKLEKLISGDIEKALLKMK